MRLGPINKHLKHVFETPGVGARSTAAAPAGQKWSAVRPADP